MKELIMLALLFILTCLIVLLIHAYLLGQSQAHPTFLYYEEVPTATPTFEDYSSSSSNLNLYGYAGNYYPYSYPYSVGVTSYGYMGPTATLTPTMVVSGPTGRRVRY